MFVLPVIIILGLLLCTAFIFPLVLIGVDHASSSPRNESEVAAVITETAESYGLSLCESTPVEVSFAGVIDTMLYRYGLACGAYSMGNNLEVLIILHKSGRQEGSFRQTKDPAGSKSGTGHRPCRDRELSYRDERTGLTKHSEQNPGTTSQHFI